MKLKEIFKKSKPIVFLDMDGCIADLYNYAADIHDVEHYNQMSQQQWEKFFKNSDAYQLFKDLPVFPSAAKLIEIIEHYAGGYCILSSPLSFDREGSIKGKKEWLTKNITKNKPEKVIFEHDKFKYAKQDDGTPNVLIDDYGKNINAWNNAGGIAIKYQADESDLSIVENTLKQIFTK
jgi:5'(3')-deoxyribonucleotidase